MRQPASPPALALHWRGMSLVAAAAVVCWLLLQWLEGWPSNGLIPSDPADQRLLINVLSRTATALISTVFACLFLAVPLTANMYTPQLIDLFVRSGTNRIVLIIFVLSAAHAVWTAHLPLTTGAEVHLGIALFLTLVSLALLLPYMFYVFRFLDPGAIIQRLSKEAIGAMQPNRPLLTDHKIRLSGWLHNLGNVVLRALDRADRDVAIEAVAALEHCATTYLREKNRYDHTWFEIDEHHFAGFSTEALALVNRERVWVEMDIMQQLSRGFSAAMAKSPDVISAISRSQRHIAMAAAEGEDHGALDLALRFFNNFLRESIKRRDNHAVYDLLYEYRMTAINLVAQRPDQCVVMAKRLGYYAHMAGETGLAFARDLMAYDLGRVIEAAASELQPPPLETTPSQPPGITPDRLGQLVDHFLAVSDLPTHRGTAPGLIKARLITAAGLRYRGCLDAASRIENTLAKSHSQETKRLGQQLLTQTDAYFWEVTDRQQNLDYVPAKLLPHLQEIIDAV